MFLSRNPPACVPLTLPNLKAEEEVRELQKKMQQLENDLDQTQEKLMNANQRLEEKEKALQNVSTQRAVSGKGGGRGVGEKDGPAGKRACDDHH